MRKLAVAGLALPVLGLVYLSAFLRRSIIARFGVLALGVVLVASGLIIGLPAKPSEAKDPTTFSPISPSNFIVRVEKDLPLDAAVEILFTKPMNEESVAAAMTIDPKTPLSLAWSDDDKRLLVKGLPNWLPIQYYTLDVPASVIGRDGQPLSGPIHTVWVTGSLTTGTLEATIPSGDRVGLATAFQLTLDRPAHLASVVGAFTIDPPVQGSFSGDDPTDRNSQIFTFTPTSALPADTTYKVSLKPSLVDARGIPVGEIDPLAVTTAVTPSVVRFRPVDKSVDVDPSQEVSVRFTTPMDTAATGAAFLVTADGKAVNGAGRWAEDDTVLVLTPAQKLPDGAKVTMTVTKQARSKEGVPLNADVTASFTVSKPAPPPVQTPAQNQTKPGPTTTIPKTDSGLGSVGSAPWSAYETYYLGLMNCTRTGGWVTSAGDCVAGGNRFGRTSAIALDAGISNLVARPYAKYIGENNIPSHFAYGTPGTRLAAKGYTSYHWAENIGWPVASYGGMVSLELFYQNEAPCSSCHFRNLMNSEYDRAGIGVWVVRGYAYTVIDFYHP